MLSQNRREAKPVYSFPELRSSEILQCLEDLRIPISEADLAKPSPSLVQRIYEAFAEIFMGATAAGLQQQQRGPKEILNGLQVAEMVEYPELHVESVGLVSFYRTLTKLMIQVGIEDFNLKDLIRPEGPRLRLILSAVINFAKFREEQLAVFEDFSRKSEDLLEQKNKLAARESELSGKISYFK